MGGPASVQLTSLTMDVNAYLNEIVNDFKVEWLEVVFDVRNTDTFLDAKQTSDYLRSITPNDTFKSAVIKRNLA